MSPILVPSRRIWTRQPHLPAQLSARCAGALVIDGRFDRIVGGRPPSTKQLGYGLGSQGISARAVRSRSRNDYPVPPTFISSSGDFTLALFLEQKSAQSGSYVYAFGSPGYPIAFAMRHSSTSYNAGLALGGSTHVNTGINASAAGVYKIVARRIAGTIYFNINGQKSSVANATTLGTITSLILNSYTNTSGYGVAGETNFYLALLDPKRGWSDAEANAFVGNPWQIFLPRVQQVFYTPGAGGGSLEIAAQLAQAAASGFVANVDRQLVFTSTLAQGSAQGLLSTIDRKLQLSAQLGGAVADGISAIISAYGQLLISASLGDGQAQGLLAGINLKKEVAALLGTANASGLSATISSESILHINATVGQAAALGHLANINRQLGVQVGVAQAIAQGFQASVVNASTTFTDAEMEEIARRLLSSGPWLVKLKVILENL